MIESLMSGSFNLYKDIVDLGPLVELIEAEGKHVFYEKNEYLLCQGEVEKHISLLKSGYCRYVRLKSDGEEAVVGFAMAGEFVTDFNNGVRHLPSIVSMIASTRVEAYRLPLDYFVNKAKEIDREFLYHASEALFRMVYMRMTDLYALTPAERYSEFVKAYPDVISTIKTWELASYLRITPQHLIRIKKSR